MYDTVQSFSHAQPHSVLALFDRKSQVEFIRIEATLNDTTKQIDITLV